MLSNIIEDENISLNLLKKISIFKKKDIKINGYSLDIIDIYFISKNKSKIDIFNDSIKEKVIKCSEYIKNKLNNNDILYGVNTGFGGSADTRNFDHIQLQLSLLKLLSVGIYNEDQIIPEDIVKAAMVIRLNSNIRGHSGITWKTLEYITLFLNNNITPCIPIRGSISASGDLIPLSYICNCLIGKKDKNVIIYEDNKKIIKPIIDVFKSLNIKPLILDAKEGLAIVNGTSFSTAIASLNIIKVNTLIIISQILTAMFIESLNGSDEYFKEFTQDIRPHKGQIEVSKNINIMLKNSKLVNNNKNFIKNILRQERYSARTSPQWIGPQLETLYECIKIIEIELNSTTDNPIIDFENDKIYHGGNFQAMSITNTMENIRLSLNHIARIIYVQNGEIINKDMNNGLPPNLCFENPSLDYGFKGIEISMASYMSEISYLSNPVSNNIQSAELHNQSINSLAFISGRYTQSVIEILEMMIAAHIYTLCQAIDLRIINIIFINKLNSYIDETFNIKFKNIFKETYTENIKKSILDYLFKNMHLDNKILFKEAFNNSLGIFINNIIENNMLKYDIELLEKLKLWYEDTQIYSLNLYLKIKKGYEYCEAKKYMGSTYLLYDYIRNVIKIPIWKYYDENDHDTYISKIFNEIKNDKLFNILIKILEKE